MKLDKNKFFENDNESCSVNCVKSSYKQSYKNNIKLQVINSDWQWQLRNRITKLKEVEKYLTLSDEEVKGILFTKFKFALTPYLLDLIPSHDYNCPIRKQFIPTVDEVKVLNSELDDPCGEELDMKLPGLVHRYPDRVLLLVTDQCASYCRFCTRRRIVGTDEHVMTDGEFGLVLRYLQEHKEVRDVLISGGDPFVLSDEKIEFFIRHIKKIRHIQIIRIGTRVPVVLPQRITENLCRTLQKYQPLYVNIHFNHPKEITSATKKACELLSNSGIPLGSQTVLLRTINDSTQVLIKLFHELLKIRVRPYYLYQCDIAKGISHFRTPFSCGVKIIENLRGFTTGLAIPTFVIDTPNGGGKIPVSPNYIISNNERRIVLRNYKKDVFVYDEIT